jgi:hypothetical protein
VIRGALGVTSSDKGCFSERLKIMADLGDLEDRDRYVGCEPFGSITERTEAQRTSGNNAAGVRPLVPLLQYRYTCTVRARRIFGSMLFCGRMFACTSLAPTRKFTWYSMITVRTREIICPKFGGITAYATFEYRLGFSKIIREFAGFSR